MSHEQARLDLLEKPKGTKMHEITVGAARFGIVFAVNEGQGAEVIWIKMKNKITVKPQWGNYSDIQAKPFVKVFEVVTKKLLERQIERREDRLNLLSFSLKKPFLTAYGMTMLINVRQNSSAPFNWYISYLDADTILTLNLHSE